MSLKVNDPVHVERDSQQQLEGVVAYLGPVLFAEGQDWVGVQLTGSSAGQGKNDGSVQGERYFSCSPGCGVFVRVAHVIPRALSRLEEVRLKKELFAPRAASGTTASMSTPRKHDSTSTIMNSPAAKGGAIANTKSPATSTQSRLDEIRARRAALVADRSTLPSAAGGSSSLRTGTSSPKAPSSAATSNVSSRAPTPDPISNVEERVLNDASGRVREQADVTNQLQNQVMELKSNLTSVQSSLELVSVKLKAREEETAALQQSLSKAEHDAHINKQLVEELRDQIQSKDQKVFQVSSAKMQEEVEELQARESNMHALYSELQDTSEKLESELKTTKLELSQERRSRATDIQELSKVRAELATVQHELNAINSQAASRSTSDASHYKERAKLQAELGAMKRANETLEAEKIDLEATLEEFTLDKEQLRDEKDALSDRVDELTIDAETAQMELEELKAELEEVKQAGGCVSTITESDDAVQGLATQNARLREALIRLREQSSYEKFELSRQLRAAEKEVDGVGYLKKELEELRLLKLSLEEQNSFLKETVDQGSAFEAMVEDLSDQVMTLEDECVALQSILREMEDAAEIAAELEEVQTEEVKSLMMDIEGRDSIVRNLEEAIKMQRRREEDFQRTLGNYRKSVETLKHEKNELLAMQRGGEGEKSAIIASSQKALTRAAQLVADAANARRREAEHAFEHIEGTLQLHLSTRLESLVPRSVVASELVAIKGELLLCNVVGKASLTLNSLSSIFGKTIRSGMHEALAAQDSTSGSSDSLSVSEETAQDIERIHYETKFARSTIAMSSELLRLLAAGQWPDLLTPEESADLGSAFTHTLPELNIMVGDTLRILIEEGCLSPHRVNIGAFQQSMQTARQELKGVRNVSGKALVVDNWSPPAWMLFQDASSAKFCCLGSGAALAAALNDNQSATGTALKSALRIIMTKLDQIAGEALRISSRISVLDLSKSKVIAELESAALEWKNSSELLLESILSVFVDKNNIKHASITHCEVSADAVLKSLAIFMTSLRAADLNGGDNGEPHGLSAECLDPWAGISGLARKIRSVDGDEDDVNFVVRASAIEQRLVAAVDNEPNLTSANNKIVILEKSLNSRSKEIAMQNARLSELEKLLAKSDVQGASRIQKSATVNEELTKLKEENRVLTDAVDVMQQQLDDYESELRLMKDPKSPKARMSVAGTVRRSLAIEDQRRGDAALAVDGSPAEIAALQSVLFRPAMDAIRREAAVWKATAVARDMSMLPPLSVNPSEAEPKERSLLSTFDTARAALRLEKASFRLVDFSSKTPPRAQYLNTLSRVSFAEEKLRVASARVYGVIALQGDAVIGNSQDINVLLGRLKFPGAIMHQKVTLSMTCEDMLRLHSQLIV